MKTENLSTLKIHKLTQEQYNRELAAGRIDENALYLTPDSPNSFVAVFGETTYEELKTVFDENPSCHISVNYFGTDENIIILNLNNFCDMHSIFEFSAFSLEGIHKVVLHEYNGWSYTCESFESLYNLLASI